jgi:hypothetical protein
MVLSEAGTLHPYYYLKYKGAGGSVALEIIDDEFLG